MNSVSPPLVNYPSDIAFIAEQLCIGFEEIWSDQDPLLKAPCDQPDDAKDNKDCKIRKRVHGKFYLLSGKALKFKYPTETSDAVLFLDRFWFPIHWEKTERDDLILWMANPLRDKTCDCCFKLPRYGMTIYCDGCGLRMCLLCAFKNGYGDLNEFGNIGFECSACTHRDILGSGHWYFALLDQMNELNEHQQGLLIDIMNRDQYRRLRIPAWNERKRLKVGCRVMIHGAVDRKLNESFAKVIQRRVIVAESEDLEDKEEEAEDIIVIKWLIRLEDQRKHGKYGSLLMDGDKLDVQCVIPRRKAIEQPRKFMQNLRNWRDIRMYPHKRARKVGRHAKRLKTCPSAF